MFDSPGDGQIVALEEGLHEHRRVVAHEEGLLEHKRIVLHAVRVLDRLGVRLDEDQVRGRNVGHRVEFEVVIDVGRVGDQDVVHRWLDS